MAKTVFEKKKEEREAEESELRALMPKFDFDENENAPFERAYLVPIRKRTIEKDLTSRGKTIESEIVDNVCNSIIITLPKTRIGEGGKAMLIDTPYSIPIPGRTDDNEAIKDRQSLRDVNRALYFSPSNGELYTLKEITKDQYSFEQKARQDRSLRRELKDKTDARRLVPEPMSGRLMNVLADEKAGDRITDSALNQLTSV